MLVIPLTRCIVRIVTGSPVPSMFYNLYALQVSPFLGLFFYCLFIGFDYLSKVTMLVFS